MSDRAWTRRQEAARAFRPKRIRLLLVTESPPADPEQYLYLDSDHAAADELFHNLAEVLFERADVARGAALKDLRRRGVFVVELKPDAPRAGGSLAPYVAPFLLNLEALAPEAIVLISNDVYDALHGPLTRADANVVDVRIPAPTPAHALEFRQKLRQALVRAGLEKAIRPLPAKAGQPD